MYNSLIFSSIHYLHSWNDDLTEFAQNLTAAEKRILEEGIVYILFITTV